MSAKKGSLCKRFLSGAVFCLVLASSVLIHGQTASKHAVGVPDDWTHHHLVFSDPGTAAEALAQGRFKQWYKITHDPRFQMQQMKRNLAQRALATAPDFATRAARLSAPSTDPGANSSASRRAAKQTLKRDWSMDMGGVAASQTGTFTASSGTGKAVVAGVTLTASAGTAASQSTTVSTNGVASGDTITITNPMVGSPLVLTASAPVAQFDTLAVSSSEPSNNAYVTIAGIEYEFETPGWTSGSEPSTTCYINRAGGQTSIVSWLASAITTGSANTGSGTSTWECGSAASQSATTGVTVTGSSSPDVIVTANTPGTTGFTTARAGTNEPTITKTAGTNGSSTSPNFVWWNGNTAATAATVATNIKTAIGTANAVGVGATDGSGLVKITATLTGLAGNSINVATTISSGLTGAAFNGNLNGGAAGTTSAAKFSTSTDRATESTNLAAEAAALASAINTNVLALTATSSGAVVTVTHKTVGPAGDSITLTETMATFSWAGATLAGGATATVGAAVYPAKYSFYTTTASCGDAATPDYIIYNTGIAGSPTQASIIAYDNLYSGCTAPYPQIYWQYNTGGTIVTSPVISPDGTQVAFIQTNASSQAQLVVLRWSNNSTLTAPTCVSPSAYASCTGPCMTSLTFAATTPFGGSASIPNDTRSSPYYDYYFDTVYVGEDNGNLHQFTGIFNGMPAESSSGFPVPVAAGPLSDPVYDAISGNVFVGPATGAGGGNFYSIASSTGAVTCSGQMAATGGTSEYADGPVVDSTAATVYIFVNEDVAGTSAAVWQLSTSFGSGAMGTEVTLGQGSLSGNLFSGTFDNIYYGNIVPTGNLYVCGRATGSQTPTIWQVPILSSVLQTPVIGPALASTTTDCSPVAEFLNGSTDSIFLSVEANNLTTSPPGCPSGNGCIMSFNVTSASGWSAGTATSATALEPGGTSGITIDNAVGSGILAGASQVYFSPLANQACAGNNGVGSTGQGTGGCAIQASQSGLN